VRDTHDLRVLADAHDEDEDEDEDDEPALVAPSSLVRDHAAI
jgi:hypothetical protein